MENVSLKVHRLWGNPLKPYHHYGAFIIFRVTPKPRVMNWSILRNRGFLLAAVANSFVCFSISLILIHLSAYARFEAELKPTQSASLISLMGIVGEYE